MRLDHLLSKDAIWTSQTVLITCISQRATRKGGVFILAVGLACGPFFLEFGHGGLRRGKAHGRRKKAQNGADGVQDCGIGGEREGVVCVVWELSGGED